MKNEKKLGRPQKFNREEVLNNLLLLFWQQGYEATSITDMTQAAGINPPSLYASFGSKEQVFELVLDHYIKTYLFSVMHCIEDNSQPVTTRIAIFLSRFIDVIASNDFPKGCMLLFEWFSYHKKPLLQLGKLQSSNQAFFDAFSAMINEGIDTGQIKLPGNAQEITTMIFVFEKGLAMQAKAGSDKATLQRISTMFVNLLTKDPNIPAL